MLKKKSNKLIAILLSVLLSGLIPATATFADVLMGDADGEFIINSAGNFVAGSYNPEATYTLKPGEKKSLPLALAIRHKGGSQDPVSFNVSGIAMLTSNPGGATLTKTSWTLENYVTSDQEEFSLDIEAPTLPDEYIYKVTFTATHNASGLDSASVIATVIVKVVEPTTPTEPLDKTDPTATLDLSTEAWTNQNVTITIDADDNKGIASISLVDENDVEIPLDLIDGNTATSKKAEYPATQNGTYTFRITDTSDNSIDKFIVVGNIDKVDPIIKGTASPAPNGNGWNNSDVTVKYEFSDALSGIKDVASPYEETISTEGANQSSTYTVWDNAGNSATSLVEDINIDKTAPEIKINMPTANTYKLNEVVLADWTATDALSGIDSAVGDVAKGVAIDTSSIGTRIFTVTATDKAGNETIETVTYKVIYDFDGFFQPIEMGKDVLNSAKAGSSIPIKFSLNGDMGLEILNGAPKAYTYYVNSSLVDEKDVDSIMTAGKSGLSYDPIADQYTYVWKTDKGWKGSAKQLAVTLKDGQTYYAYFTFK